MLLVLWMFLLAHLILSQGQCARMPNYVTVMPYLSLNLLAQKAYIHAIILTTEEQSISLFLFMRGSSNDFFSL